MPRTRAKDYGSVHDAEGLDPVKPDVKAPILGQLENPSLLTNPDPEKYLDHNMVPHARHSKEGDFKAEDHYMSADEDAFISAEEEMDQAPPMARSVLKKMTRESCDDLGGGQDSPRDSHQGDSTPLRNLKIYTPGSDLQARPKLPKVPKLPTLQDQLQLTRHLMLCEDLMEEEGVDLKRLAAKVAICESVSGWPEVKKTAESMLTLPWSVMKANLIADFADINVMRTQLENRLLALKFDSTKMTAFVNGARALWSLRTPDIEQSWFVRRLFRTVPVDLLERVVTEARKIDSRVEWSMLSMEKILNLLSEAVIVRNAVIQVNDQNDGLKYMGGGQPEGGGKPTYQRGSSGGLAAWVERCKGRLFVVFVTDAETVKSIKGRAKEVKEMKGRKGNRYLLVEYLTKEEGVMHLKQMLKNERDWREFRSN